jgi:hypothetical protein
MNLVPRDGNLVGFNLSTCCEMWFRRTQDQGAVTVDRIEYLR